MRELVQLGILAYVVPEAKRYIFSSDVTAGDIITVINANTCETLDDFRKAIVEKSFNLDKDLYSYMKLDSEAQIVINISKAYADESELSQRYKYKISTLYDKLCQQ